MYAVVRTGGKQYRVAAGDILEVEKLEGEVGDMVTLDEVLLVSSGDTTTIGQPRVEDASVVATITGQHKGRKIQVFRYRPKKRIRVRRGHRQLQTRLEISAIHAHGAVHVAEVVAEPEVEEVVVVAEAVAETVAEAEAAAVEEVVEEEAEEAAGEVTEAVAVLDDADDNADDLSAEDSGTEEKE
ncbi:MAG: 50S ribosomal protein L21 [Caldilineaceae bacterium]|nr:50S ribosomal protein L21 [Caldilineaceae bacterium]